MEAVLACQWNVESLTGMGCDAASTDGASSVWMGRDPDPTATGVQGMMQHSGLLDLIGDHSAGKKSLNCCQS